MKWGKISLKNVVGSISESHNSDATELYNDVFNSDYQGEADLRFCAVLLRLADIMDFDNSRTPRSVYEYLDLDNPKNKNEEINQDEWNKHLCSDGFTFEHTSDEIKVRFRAGPNHPQVEKNINTFLDVIDDELQKCGKVVQRCSPKWRDFKLPDRIDRSGIEPQNYKKGDYRLSLDETQIIKLLTGENLYDNELVFVREILQNAIDTSRMREYHEHSHGNSQFEIKPIDITTWIDQQGYRWLRVDDYGMGINEYVVENHLLRKGNSYYNSDYFKLQKHHYKSELQRDFTPISRFGIGLLSCFILGDAIEINTKSIAVPETNSAEEKIRISIQGLQSQYIIQTQKSNHNPILFPAKHALEKSFRVEAGTSIAVRISRIKDHIHFQQALDWAVKHFVLCSPVPIFYEHEKIDGDFKEILETPFTETSFQSFSPNEKKEIEELIGRNIESDIGIEAISINVSENSKNQNLQGQLGILRLKCDDFEKAKFHKDFDFHINIENPAEKKSIKFNKKYQINGKEQDKSATIDITDFFQAKFKILLRTELFSFKHSHFSSHLVTNIIRLSHNGIMIPNLHGISHRQNQKIAFSERFLTYGGNYFRDDRSIAYFGLLYLQDSLIPDLTVARNEIKKFGFSFFSTLYYATRELNKYEPKRHPYIYFKEEDEFFSFRDIKQDELIINGTWNEEKFIQTNIGLCSINDLKLKVINRENIHLPLLQGNNFVVELIKGLLQLNFKLEFVLEGYDNYYLIPIQKQHILEDNSIDTLTPLVFAPFKNKEGILSFKKIIINSSHFLGLWLLVNQTMLIENHNGYFSSLVGFILEENIQEINEVINHFRTVLPKGQKPEFRAIQEDDFLKKSNKPPF